LIKKLIKAAKENGLKDEVINDILNQKTQSHGFFSKIHKYSDLLEGRPQIDEILRIDRKNDEHTISNKTFDFSTGTIKLLLERGYDDAKDEINQYLRNQLVT
jgi:NTE family protein